jgi:hypothetical protein
MLKALIEKLNLSYDDFKITDTESIVKRHKIFGFYIYACALNNGRQCLLISKKNYGDFCSGVDITKVYRINSNKIFLEI